MQCVKRFVLYAVLLMAFALSMTSAFAASITRDTPATISGDTDVSTSGTLVYAYNGANSTVSVNGVSFTGANSYTTWGSVTFSGFTGIATTGFGGSGSPWADLSSAYKTNLQGAAYGNSATVTVTLSGLTIGIHISCKSGLTTAAQAKPPEMKRSPASAATPSLWCCSGLERIHRDFQL